MNKPAVWQRAAAVLLALLVWQAAASLLNESILLVSPWTVLGRLFTIWREPGFAATLLFSFVRIAGGFLAGLICGTLLGILAGRYPVLEILLWPYMITIKSVPVASFIILCLIWLTSSQLSMFISFLMVLPIVYTNLLSGIRGLDPRLNEMADVFRVPWRRRLHYIWLPQLRPFFTSACGVSLGLAWKSGIAAEVIGIPAGSIGERLYEAKAYLNTPDLFAWTILIVAVSVCFEKLFMRLLRLGFQALEKS